MHVYYSSSYVARKQKDTHTLFVQFKSTKKTVPANNFYMNSFELGLFFGMRIEFFNVKRRNTG